VDRPAHWDNVYRTRDESSLSWHEAVPSASLAAIEAHASIDAAIVDVGAGTSHLVDSLLEHGFTDVTALDVSALALTIVEARLGDTTGRVTLVCSDVLDWSPPRTFDVWHDRAVFHFLTDADDRARYAQVVSNALPPGGLLIMATFADDAPDHCSGLPVRRYRADELAAQFPAFDVLAASRVEHTTPAGAIQPFTFVTLARR
jgi:SAM-dependent methyltransferase